MDGVSASLLEHIHFRWKVVRTQPFMYADLFGKVAAGLTKAFGSWCLLFGG